MNISTRIYTWLYGIYIGQDDIGNKYYANSKNFEDHKTKRWVIFKGETEASKIPAHWHAWLHKSVNLPPLNYKHKYKWQKNHIENMTGTKNAYFPSSYPLSKNYKPNEKNDDYESWSP
tara:strand:- start:35677 stop:36030 length:354 start_codon:yes stop_codon:yes gene_type:complete